MQLAEESYPFCPFQGLVYRRLNLSPGPAPLQEVKSFLGYPLAVLELANDEARCYAEGNCKPYH